LACADGCYTAVPLNGKCHAFLLTPNTVTATVPEPATVTLFTAGMLSLAGLRRRYRVGDRS
jgi:hypothetical protein